MSWLIAILIAAAVLAVALVLYRRFGPAGTGSGGPWWRRAWAWLLEAFSPEPAVAAIPEPVPADPEPLPPPPPAPRAAPPNGHAPAGPAPDAPQPSMGTQSDLLHSITSLVNKASQGDIRDVRRCLKTLATAADCLGAGVAHLGRRLAEPDKHYGHEIWEPCGMAGSQIRSGALHLGQSDAMVASLQRTTVGELANSPRRAPHASQLNGPV